ncbi:MAG TPA: hypothetical protein VG672_05340, partial [Bryobacteraceae bacterium]|nr:hypothetical protein [Bryobacteraceae bacterium]
EVLAPGFKTAVHTAVELKVGQTLQFDVRLEVGQAAETVTISAEQAQIVEQNARIATVVETRQITELPLNGRQFAQLILLTPGALPVALGQSTSFKVQLGAGSYSPVIAGQRNRFNNFTLDGVENNDPMFNSYAMNPSVDAIQEFSVQSRGNASEQARTMGSDVVVVTRSGTNEYHGAAWEFLRNTVLDARNFFDPARPQFKQNQFGGTFGGPLRLPRYRGRDRTFFFGYYEGFRYVRSANSVASVPTAAMREGDFSGAGVPRLYDISTTRASAAAPSGYARDPFPGNLIPSSRIAANTRDILNLYPLATLPGITRNYINTTPQRQQNDQASLRIDQKITERNNLFGRISYNDGYNASPGSVPVVVTNITNKAWNATVSDTQILKLNLLLHLQFGLNRYTSNRSGRPLPDNLLSATGWDKLYPSGPPDLLMLSLAINDAPSLGGAFTPIGPHTFYQGITDLSYVRGRHNFKTGFTWNTLRSFQASPQADITFGRQPTSDLVDQAATGYGVATFLLGLPTASRRAAGDTSARLSNNEFHYFLQDEVRLTRALTLTAGIRYSYVQAFREARDAYAGFDVKTGDYLLAVKNPVTGAGPNVRARYIDPDWNNFAPRLGLAYALTPRISLRAGAGIFYSFTDGIQFAADPAGNWPFGFSESVGPLNEFFAETPFTNPFSRSAGVAMPSGPEGQGGYAMDPRMKTPYATQWNFGIQTQLPGDLLFEATYLGSTSVKLLNSVWVNLAVPGPGPVQSRRPYPQYSMIDYDQNTAPAHYNGLSMKVQKRFANGLSFLSSYTWSHTLDIWSTEREAAGPQDPLNWRADYATSTSDVTHAFLFSNVYELPAGRGKRFLHRGLLSYVLGNWQWSNIIGLYGGQPIDIQLGVDNASKGRPGGQRPNLAGNPFPEHQTRLNWINKAAFLTPAPLQYGNLGRNIMRGPGLKNWDMALSKNIRWRERTTVQLRADFFNTFNFVNFGNPDTTLSSTNFGVITSARSPRSIQFGLKISF